LNENSNQDHDRFTVVGTDIEEVKRLNANSGLSYNEVKALVARTTGGQGTSSYSNTDLEESRLKNQSLDDK
jgi:hypothetical protein